MILELKTNSAASINMAPISPKTCLNRKPSEVAAIQLQSSEMQKPTVGDLFKIHEDEPEKLIIRNSSRLLDQLGAAMDEGEMLIEGDTGNFLAQNMSGGTLQVSGCTGHHAASAMLGGELRISGDTGNFLGGAASGAMKGMSGGTIIVKGSSGNRVGDRMRKGLIIIKGNTGEYCASRMIAGTIVMLGQIGTHLGVMMKRGSLITSPDIAVDENFFSKGTEQKINFLPLLIKHLHTLDQQLAEIPITTQTKRHIGDLSAGGTGEILKIAL